MLKSPRGLLNSESDRGVNCQTQRLEHEATGVTPSPRLAFPDRLAFYSLRFTPLEFLKLAVLVTAILAVAGGDPGRFLVRVHLRRRRRFLEQRLLH